MARITPSWLLVDSFAKGELCAGIDEVGRGAWAGPVVAAAVILPYGLQIEGLADSKLLSHAARVRLDRIIRARALAVGIGWVGAEEVDAGGLSWAVRESGLRALVGMPEASLVLLDGKHNYLADDPRAHVFIKGDAHITPIAAASVVAKVARDNYLGALAKPFPGYGLEIHKGYGTARHRHAIADFGLTPHHRHSYKPLQGYGSCR